MNNSDSIREFFRKMAEGNSASAARFDALHNTQSFVSRTTHREELSHAISVASERDYGIGLPPLASC
jgi:hypothetical protein